MSLILAKKFSSIAYFQVNNPGPVTPPGNDTASLNHEPAVFHWTPDTKLVKLNTKILRSQNSFRDFHKSGKKLVELDRTHCGPMAAII